MGDAEAPKAVLARGRAPVLEVATLCVVYDLEIPHEWQGVCGAGRGWAGAEGCWGGEQSQMLRSVTPGWLPERFFFSSVQQAGRKANLRPVGLGCTGRLQPVFATAKCAVQQGHCVARAFILKIKY